MHSSSVFDETQYALPYAPGVERHFWTVARNRIVARHVRNALKQAPDKAVLDVGCGRGITVGYLRQSGIECYGVELGSPEVEPALQPYVKVGTDATELPSEFKTRIGTIMLLDVVEHIERPAEFLNALLAAYPNVVNLIVTVPSFMELWSNYDVFYGHFLRYTKKDLQDLAQASGLEVSAQKYFFSSLYPVMRGLMVSTRQRNVEITPPSGATSIALHRFIGLAFAMEERMSLGRWLPGTSLLGVLSRTPARAASRS